MQIKKLPIRRAAQGVIKLNRQETKLYEDYRQANANAEIEHCQKERRYKYFYPYQKQGAGAGAIRHKT